MTLPNIDTDATDLPIAQGTTLRPSRIYLNAKQIVQVHTELLRVCHSGPNNTAIYDTGYDDEACAERLIAELGFPITKHNIAGIRKQLIGELVKRTSSNKLSELNKRLSHLEEQVEGLRLTLNNLQEKYTELTGLIQSVDMIGDNAVKSSS